MRRDFGVTLPPVGRRMMPHGPLGVSRTPEVRRRRARAMELVRAWNDGQLDLVGLASRLESLRRNAARTVVRP